MCHSLSPDKRKLFCLFVCRGTLSYYGVGAFSLPIPHGMHLMVPAQLCPFGWYVILAGHFPQKSPSRNLKNRFSPSPHHQTMPPLSPFTSSRPICLSPRPIIHYSYRLGLMSFLSVCQLLSVRVAGLLPSSWASEMAINTHLKKYLVLYNSLIYRRLQAR